MIMPSAGSVQLGAIGFINTLPIYGPWDPQPGVQLTTASPAVLNAALLSGQLHVSPVSSAFYLAHQSMLTLLPGLSVSSFGHVSSVLVLSDRPLQQTDTIALPDDSATSVALLKLFCRDQLGRLPNMPIYPADQLSTALQQSPAALVIGDRALSASVSPPTAHVVDLSDWWVARTKLPIVFAVWAANRKWHDRFAARAKTIMESLQQSRDLFLTDPLIQTLTIEAATTQSGLPASVIRRYFLNSLNYQWQADHQASLLCMAQALLDNGLSEA